MENNERAIKKYDAIVIGAGSSGLFFCYELSTLTNGKIKILLIDKGKNIINRDHKDLLHGIGGAGLFSDGKLNLSDRIGGNLHHILKDKAMELIQYVDNIFVNCGVQNSFYGNSTAFLNLQKEIGGYNNMELIYVPQKHIGSDKNPTVIQNLIKQFKNVEIMTEAEVKNFDVNEKKMVYLSDGRVLECDFLVVGVGQNSKKWVEKILVSYGIDISARYADIGVRVEVKVEDYKKLTDMAWDPKIHFSTGKYPSRTLCTCPYGYVVKEDHDSYVCVNGYSNSYSKSENTNFAIIVKVPKHNPLDYCIKIGTMIASETDKKPILQSYLNFKNRDSSQGLFNNRVQPTLKNCSYLNLWDFYEDDILATIVTAIDTLSRAVPNVSHPSTLIYGPEFKLYSSEVDVDKNFETMIKNLYVIGDCSGKTHGIVSSAVTGVVSARHIYEKI